MCKSANPTTIYVLTIQEIPLGRTPQEMLVLTVSHCHTGPQKARTTTGIGEIIGNHCLGYHYPPQTMGLKVIGAHYQQLHQCCPCQIDQRDPSIPSMEGDTERMEPI